MNFYLYNVTIFDTAPDADLSIFPKTEPHVAIAENETEAQRQIVEKLYDEELGGTCARYSTREDSPRRFNIVFSEPSLVDEVVWNYDLYDGEGGWDWANPH